MNSSSIPVPSVSYNKYDQAQSYGSEALEPIGGWSKSSYSKENGHDRQTSLPHQPSEPSVWSFSAKLFIILISFFVVTTSLPLIIIMSLQYTGSKRFGVHLSDTGFSNLKRSSPNSSFSVQRYTPFARGTCLPSSWFFALTSTSSSQASSRQLSDDLISSPTPTRMVRRSPSSTSRTCCSGRSSSGSMLSHRLRLVCPSTLPRTRLAGVQKVLRRRRSRQTLPQCSHYSISRSLLYRLRLHRVLHRRPYSIAIDQLDVPPQPGKIPGANVSAGVLVACWTFGALPLYLGMEKESRKSVGISLGVQALGMVAHYASGVILLDLVTLVVRKAKETGQETFAAAESNQWKTYFQYATISLLLLLNFIWSVVVLRGFGKGLKEREESQIQGVNRRTIEELDLSA